MIRKQEICKLKFGVYMKQRITVAYGDGIGPEIMEATLRILERGGAEISQETVEIGEKAYLAGHLTGMDEKCWDSIRKTKVFLKAPITTPQGGGYRSLNVTVRTRMGLYANIRPAISYAPFIETKHPKMDLVIVRENEEDLYVGVEYRGAPDVYHAIKLITKPGSERIIRYAFAFAKQYGRKRVTCFTKDNILKLTDGTFHKIFEEVGSEYPEIEQDHYIVDIGAARLADTPEKFDVIVLPNLYGDILSDVAAQISGSVGLAGSANIGLHGAMFEAIHGSAPKYAGKNVANPSGLLHGAIMMLIHIHQTTAASRIHNAWLKTIEDGIHTLDIFKEGKSKQLVGTKEFADEVIKRLGQKPQTLKSVNYESKNETLTHFGSTPTKTKRELVGVDIYLYSHDNIEDLVSSLKDLHNPSLELKMISNRGAEVWPQSFPETFCVEVWRCRYMSHAPLSHQIIASLLHRLADGHIEVIKTENLYTYDGKPGFSS